MNLFSSIIPSWAVEELSPLFIEINTLSNIWHWKCSVHMGEDQCSYQSAFAVFPSKFGFPFGVFLVGLFWPLKTKCHISIASSSKELAKHRFYKRQNAKQKLADNSYYNLYYFWYNQWYNIDLPHQLLSSTSWPVIILVSTSVMIDGPPSNLKHPCWDDQLHIFSTYIWLWMHLLLYITQKFLILYFPVELYIEETILFPWLMKYGFLWSIFHLKSRLREKFKLDGNPNILSIQCQCLLYNK